jgi:hypothetical protein
MYGAQSARSISKKSETQATRYQTACLRPKQKEGRGATRLGKLSMSLLPHVLVARAAGRWVKPLIATAIPTSSSSRLISIYPSPSHLSAPSRRSLSTSSKLDLRMANPETTKEVRKYLQQSHDRIFENNKKWAEEMKAKKPEFFTDLSAGQAPEYLWIGVFRLFLYSRISTSHHPDRVKVSYCRPRPRKG